ncbi:MAG: S41 family peptidase [Planctomycetes bacterium]|nr:S41 family peptidase [Planctomycetota bacterium]
MQNRVFTKCPRPSLVAIRQAWPFLALAALGCFFSAPTLAQSPAFAEPVTIVPEAQPAFSLGTVLERGLRLESNKRWGEALSHYEDALREHRDNSQLQQRHELAKLHYSFDRRYHDRSFRQSITALDRQQTLTLFSELLQKTSTHYVKVPVWQELGQRGVRALDIALQEREFTSVNRLQASASQISQLRQDIARMLSSRPLSSSRDVVTLAGDVAKRAEAQIGLAPTATVLEFVAAAANGLDDYSAYLTADQLREVYSQIEGNFVGLGVELKAEDGALLIVHVIPGSPAERAGILARDRIVAVDGKSTSELSTDEAASMLTGAEGSWVRVTAYSPGKQPRVINVRREHVEVPSMEDVKIVDKDFGIAYLRIPTFQKTTSRDLEAALWDLHRKGMRSLILDLRGNPGGLLTSSVEVADKFLTQGSIVSTRGRSAQEDFNYQAHYGGTWRVPLVVLIDEDSASASEIFAGAIKDNNRGIIVGNTSFGKGSVQGIFPLGYAGAGIRLTTAKFFSPNGTPISRHGVEPDVNVHTVARPIDAGIAELGDESDAILQAGIEAARSKMAAR